MSRQQRKNQEKARRQKGKGRRHGDYDEFDDFDLDEGEDEQVTKKKKKKEEDEEVVKDEEDD